MSSPVAVHAPSPSTHVVRVPVTTVWSSPESPRPVDAPVVADEPGRRRVAGRPRRAAPPTTSRATAGSVCTAGSSRSCSRVSPSSSTEHRRVRLVVPRRRPVAALPQGRPRLPRLGADAPTSPPSAEPPRSTGPTRRARRVRAPDVDDAGHPAVAEARRHLGLPYLWSGISPFGFDCSGLVLHTWRRIGVVVARDAYAQADFAAPVALDAVRPGDLYFFARPGPADPPRRHRRAPRVAWSTRPRPAASSSRRTCPPTASPPSSPPGACRCRERRPPHRPPARPRRCRLRPVRRRLRRHARPAHRSPRLGAAAPALRDGHPVCRRAALVARSQPVRLGHGRALRTGARGDEHLVLRLAGPPAHRRRRDDRVPRTRWGSPPR